MSVINEMLRDLERRGGSEPVAQEPVLDGVKLGPPAQAPLPVSKWSTIGPTLGIAAIMVIGFGLIEWRIERSMSAQQRAAARDPSSLLLQESIAGLRVPPVEALPEPMATANEVPAALPVAVAQAVVPAAPAPVAQINPAPAEPVRLLGADLDRGDSRTRISFELSGRTTHRVEHGEDNRMALVLNGARMGESTPQLRLGGSLLKSLHVSREADDLRIQLQPVGAVHAQSTMVVRRDSARLILTLEPAEVAEIRVEAQEEAAEPIEVYETHAVVEDFPAPAEVAEPIANAAGRFRRTAAAPQARSSEQTARDSYRRARELIAAGSDEIALQALREALAYAPDYLPSHVALSSVLIRLGRPEEARRAIREGWRFEPGNTELAKLEARLLIADQVPDQALGVLLSAPPPLHEDPEYHAMIAALYQRIGQHERAAHTFRQLVGLRQSRAAWWMGLGISLEGEGKVSDALAAYRNASRLGGLQDDSAGFTRARIEALDGKAG